MASAPGLDAARLFNAVVAERAAAAGVILEETADMAIAGLQSRRGQTVALLAKLQAEFGAQAADAPRYVRIGETAILGIGPGRWWAVRASGGHGYAASLARDLAGLASVVDQSDGYRILQVSGPGARDFLARGVALDLHPRAFAVGAAATTEIAHIGVTLWQADAVPTYTLAIPRSFAGSFAHWLAVTAAARAVASLG